MKIQRQPRASAKSESIPWNKPEWARNVSAGKRDAENILFEDCEELDLTESALVPIIICTSILWRSKQSGTVVKACAGYPDGAKIYICYRRCCFLTR